MSRKKAKKLRAELDRVRRELKASEQRGGRHWPPRLDVEGFRVRDWRINKDADS